MCIYLGKDSNLTYTTQEHVLPAALGCCTKLDKGLVSDQANKYFSPIERDVIEHSFIQIPRIIKGPGKRGKLSPKYATTSEVCPIKHYGRNCLGYMKGTEGYILCQFIISQENKIQFYNQTKDNINNQKEIMDLKEHIVLMGEKYVPVEMPQDDKNIYIAYFKDKIHIGYNGTLSERRLFEVKKMFCGDINIGRKSTESDQISATIHIKHNFRNSCIVAAKSAINTLVYVKGAEYTTQTHEFDEIIKQVMSGSDDIFNRVKGIRLEGVEKMRQKLYLNNEQQACIIREDMKQLKAWVFFYDQGFEVLLCENLKSPYSLTIDGIICDWKNRKDYRFLEYILEKVSPTPN